MRKYQDSDYAVNKFSPSRINICFKYQYDYDRALELIQNIQRLQSADAVLPAKEAV